MNLESQVCNLHLAKQLQQLGVKQESFFWWHDNEVEFMHPDTANKKVCIAAFSVGELDNLLPDAVCFGNPEKGKKQYYPIIYTKQGNNYHANIISIPVAKMIHEILSDNPANTKALLLIKLIENELMEVPK